jgi:hypothetical protein
LDFCSPRLRRLLFLSGKLSDNDVDGDNVFLGHYYLASSRTLMTYIETLLLIQERGETVLNQDVRALITNQHRYIREIDQAESCWREDNEPGAPERHFGRGGEYYIWKRTEEP